MIQQRSFSLLSSAEKHLLRQNRAYAGQCIRCIHTSKPVKAEESKGNGNDNGTPYNAPKRGPNRQERAAKVSSQVSALAADLPPKATRNAEVNGAQPKSSGVSPQSQGKDVPPGRMGENDSPRKEGPFAQGVGRVVRASEEDPTYSKEARGIRTPDSKIETPSEGGASVMEPMGAAAPEAPVSKQPNAGTAEAPAATTTPTTKYSPVAPAKEVIPPSKSAQTIAEYLHSGNGTSTLLNSNFQGMIADRAAVLSPRSSPSTPTTAEVAFRLRRNKKQLTAFCTQADKDAFTKARAESKLPTFRPLPISVRQVIINRMVRGRYDKHGLLRGFELHKRQPLLNPIHGELLKNPTYLAKDAQQFMAKLKGLLPTVAIEAAASEQKPEVKKTKA